MKPVTVSVDVPNNREDVYEFLDVLANHEPFTDHLMIDWEYSGSRAGVGAKANARVKAPGSNENVAIEVIEADPPRRIVEETPERRRQAAHARHLHAHRSAGGRLHPPSHER